MRLHPLAYFSITCSKYQTMCNDLNNELILQLIVSLSHHLRLITLPVLYHLLQNKDLIYGVHTACSFNRQKCHILYILDKLG